MGAAFFWFFGEKFVSGAIFALVFFFAGIAFHRMLR